MRIVRLVAFIVGALVTPFVASGAMLGAAPHFSGESDSSDPPPARADMQSNGTSTREGLPAFYELHAWAGRNNPNGTFVDWNTRVSCDGN